MIFSKTTGSAFLGAALLLGLNAREASAVSMGVGVKGGVNFANAAVEDFDTEGMTKFVLGGALEFGVTSPFSLVIEALYNQTGATLDAGVLDDNEGELSYLEFPILGKAKFGSIARHAYIVAGPNIGINLTSEGNTAFGGFEADDAVAPVNFALDGGIGGGIQLAKYIYLTLDARYSFGLINILEDEIAGVEDWKTRDIKLMGGLLFHLTE